jgi:hypothetical protein
MVANKAVSVKCVFEKMRLFEVPGLAFLALTLFAFRHVPDLSPGKNSFHFYLAAAGTKKPVGRRRRAGVLTYLCHLASPTPLYFCGHSIAQSGKAGQAGGGIFQRGLCP